MSQKFDGKKAGTNGKNRQQKVFELSNKLQKMLKLPVELSWSYMTQKLLSSLKNPPSKPTKINGQLERPSGVVGSQEATGTSDPRCPRMPLSTLACDETSGRPARPLLGAESPNLTGGWDWNNITTGVMKHEMKCYPSTITKLKWDFLGLF